MKKLIAFAFVALFLVSMSVVSLAQISTVPPDVEQVLQEAVRAEQADPPIDLDFLWDVKFDDGLVTYLQTFKDSPLLIDLGDVFIQYVNGQTTIFVGVNDSCTDTIECHSDGPFMTGYYEEERGKKECAQKILGALHMHRQSELWPALKKAVQRYVPPDKK